MAHALYSVVITPIQIILEFFYQLIYEVTYSKGLAVIGLSFVVSLSTLPLYMVAEKWQQVERDTQARLKSGVDRIKAAFKGDEQYMILSTYYRQNHYHPMMALRSSVSLLIQVPFFIAAYNFLSNLEPLRGYSFWFIKDFGAADAMFKIGSFSVNILPIAMTLINCAAGAIYTRGFAFREKLQIYGMAAIFLILLYNSPSGLVLYWTMNNVLSLAKNIFYKIKNPRRVLFVLLCVASAGMIYYAIAKMKGFVLELRAIVACFALAIVAAPFILRAVSKFFETHFTILAENKKLRAVIFVLSAVSLALLAGLVIPTTVIDSEPVNFCYVDGYKSPFVFVREPFFQALGLFFLWPLCFYALFSDKMKKIMCVLFSVVAFYAIINCFAFSGNYGSLNNDLSFMGVTNFSAGKFEFTINLLCLIFASSVIIFMFEKFAHHFRTLSTVLMLGLFTISLFNIFSIQKFYSNMEEPEVATAIEPVFQISKDKHNVVVLMLDSCVSAYIAEIFEEKPELRKQFEGFVFYPNTVSLANLTMTAIPGVLGGYDYTPYESNLRTDKTIQQKHNEALLTLPVIFTENNFSASVANLSYENFAQAPLTAMYKDYPKINRVLTEGVYADVWYSKHGLEKEPYVSFSLKRNFIWFGFFKMAPPILRKFFYHHRYWLAYNPYGNLDEFIRRFSVLDFLPELTSVADSDDKNKKGNCIIIDDNTIHDCIVLQEPEYLPAKTVSNPNTKYSNNAVFSTMTAVFLQLGEFFEYLKSNGAYDNTRIIIVSDHGIGESYADLKYSTGEHARVIPTLMVKDFDATGQIKDDLTFMTNADTPYLATKDIIPNAKNPFTGNLLQVDDKNKYIKISRAIGESTRIGSNTKFKINAEDWWTVHDNIFVPENWKQGLE